MDLQYGSFALCSFFNIIEVDGKFLTHDRKFLRTASESPIVWPGCDNFNFDHSSNCQDRNVNNEPITMSNQPMQSQNNEFSNVRRTRTRVIKPPAGYQDYVMS